MAGLDEDALTALEGALERHVDGMTPGIVALVARGEAVRVLAEGRADFGGPRMRRDTIFRIASMTKPVAAAAAMVLVDEGRIALDEPVGRLVPELARPRVLAQPAQRGEVDRTALVAAAQVQQQRHQQRSERGQSQRRQQHQVHRPPASARGSNNRRRARSSGSSRQQQA